MENREGTHWLPTGFFSLTLIGRWTKSIATSHHIQTNERTFSCPRAIFHPGSWLYMWPNESMIGAVLRDLGLHMSGITEKLIETDVFSYNFNWTQWLPHRKAHGSINLAHCSLTGKELLITTARATCSAIKCTFDLFSWEWQGGVVTRNRAESQQYSTSKFWLAPLVTSV